MDFLSTNVETLFQLVLGVVGVAALVATLTPNTSDNRIVQFILDLVNFLGANIGQATNKDE